MSNVIFPRKRSVNLEAQVRDRLRSWIGGQTEVVTKAGRIDLLTDTQIIEVKKWSNWKEALGQVLAYSTFFPTHQKRIHLFGTLIEYIKFPYIANACESFDVLVTSISLWDQDGNLYPPEKIESMSFGCAYHGDLWDDSIQNELVRDRIDALYETNPDWATRLFARYLAEEIESAILFKQYEDAEHGIDMLSKINPETANKLRDKLEVILF